MRDLLLEFANKYKQCLAQAEIMRKYKRMILTEWLSKFLSFFICESLDKTPFSATIEPLFQLFQ